MFKKIIALGLVVSYCSSLSAAAINAQLSNDTARFMFTGGGTLTRLQYEAGLIYDSSQDYLAMAGLLVSGENIDAPVVASLGLRAYFGDATNANNSTTTVSVIALGGDLSFTPVSVPGFEFGGHYYIAPEPVSFGDSNKLIDYGIRAGYQIIPLSTLYIGYQTLTVDIENQGTITLDEGVIFGMRFTF